MPYPEEASTAEMVNYTVQTLWSYGSALQVGQVIRIIWVTFCPGQVGLTHFTEYLGRMRSRVTIS